MKRILDKIDLLHEKIQSLDTPVSAERAILEDLVHDLKETTNEVQKQMAHNIAEGHQKLEYESELLKEAVRVRDEYQEQNKQMIDSHRLLLSEFDKRNQELEQRLYERNQLIVAQAKFIVDRDKNLDY